MIRDSGQGYKFQRSRFCYHGAFSRHGKKSRKIYQCHESVTFK